MLNEVSRLDRAVLFLFGSALLIGCSSSSGSLDSVLVAEEDVNVEQVESAEAMSADVVVESAGLAIDVTSVSDGDSFRATSAEGELEVRLIGLNAPEQDECFGGEAKERLAQLLNGDTVTLHPWPPEVDDFGRELGFVVSDGEFVNLSLVETGHVLARAQSNHEFVEVFDEAEASAIDAERGLWADDACGEPVEGDLEIVEVFENAPGDDRENPNGEWVLIENVGDTTVQLQGWGIRDESTRHRYEFPSVEIAPGESVQLRTGCGTNDTYTDPIELFWCDPEPPVWNNDGDLALLVDPNGTIVSEYSYE